MVLHLQIYRALKPKDSKSSITQLELEKQELIEQLNSNRFSLESESNGKFNWNQFLFVCLNNLTRYLALTSKRFGANKNTGKRKTRAREPQRVLPGYHRRASEQAKRIRKYCEWRGLLPADRHWAQLGRHRGDTKQSAAPLLWYLRRVRSSRYRGLSAAVNGP